MLATCADESVEALDFIAGKLIYILDFRWNRKKEPGW